MLVTINADVLCVLVSKNESGDVTIACFTFVKFPIYMEPQEIVRAAGRVNTRKSLTPSSSRNASPASFKNIKNSPDSKSLSSPNIIKSQSPNFKKSPKRKKLSSVSFFDVVVVAVTLLAPIIY